MCKSLLLLALLEILTSVQLKEHLGLSTNACTAIVEYWQCGCYSMGCGSSFWQAEKNSSGKIFPNNTVEIVLIFFLTDAQWSND